MIKKRVTLPIGDDEIQIDVNFRVVEIVESVFDANADWVATQILTDARKLKFSKIADVIADWVSPYTTDRRARIREAVIQAPPEHLQTYIGAIQAACLYCRNHITDEQFDTLSAGEDLQKKTPSGGKRKGRSKSSTG